MSQYEVYTSVIQRVLQDEECLPSLPSITLKIRQAIADDSATVRQLVSLIRTDPGLSALLMKSASSPLYKTASPVKTLDGVVALIGMDAVNNLVMLHSVRGMFVSKDPRLKLLFDRTWRRQIMKAGLSCFLAKKLRYQSVDEVLICSLLSEVGSLAVISAFNDLKEVPDAQDYITLCRNYSKLLGVTLLTKWNVDEELIEVIKHCGQWEETNTGRITGTDIINLSLYHTVLWMNSSAKLPNVETLALYPKLCPPDNEINDNHELVLVARHKDQVKQIVASLQ